MGSVIPLKKSANSAYLELKNLLGLKLHKVETLIEQKLKSDVELIKKMSESGVSVWLVNTGWTGGPYGIGKRMELKYTRAMINAAMSGELDKLNADNYHIHSVFNLMQPRICPNVPTSVLSPRQTWNNDEKYYKKAYMLSQAFVNNFEKFSNKADNEILSGAPNIK